MRTLTLFVAIVAALFFASPGHAFNWDMFVPAITSCDSYPFPSCRARTLCQAEGNYWYNDRCNTEKHPDQEALEKLAGYWKISVLFDYCGDTSTMSIDFLLLDKTKISDDNLQVAQYEGKTLSIVDRDIYMPPEPKSDHGRSPYYLYAIVGDSPGSYILKDVHNDVNMDFTYYCYLGDGKVAEYHVPRGTGIYSFNLVPKDKMVGRVCYVNDGTCYDFIGEKLPHSLYP